MMLAISFVLLQIRLTRSTTRRISPEGDVELGDGRRLLNSTAAHRRASLVVLTDKGRRSEMCNRETDSEQFVEQEKPT